MKKRIQEKIQDNSGITLTVLVITIIIMGIILSISLYEGNKIIKTSNVQTKETNMLAIEAKAKAYAEEIESKIWTENNETKKDEARNSEFEARHMVETTVSQDALNQVSSEIKTKYAAYKVSLEALSDMGLSGIEGDKYIVIFSKTDYKLMDVIYIDGVVYNNNTFYTLSTLKLELENE